MLDEGDAAYCEQHMLPSDESCVSRQIDVLRVGCPTMFNVPLGTGATVGGHHVDPRDSRCRPDLAFTPAPVDGPLSLRYRHGAADFLGDVPITRLADARRVRCHGRSHAVAPGGLLDPPDRAIVDRREPTSAYSALLLSMAMQ